MLNNNSKKNIRKMFENSIYSNISQPIISKVKGKLGNSRHGEFRRAYDIAIDSKTSKIYYTTDNGTNKIIVFNSEGDFCYNVHLKVNNIQDSRGIPLGITINNNTVYVTDSVNGLIAFTLEGELITKCKNVVTKCCEYFQFDNCKRMSCSTEGEIYMCENGNSKLIKLSPDYPTFTNVGKRIKTWPLDVQCKNNEVVVLTNENPCLYILTIDGDIIRKIISKGMLNQIMTSHSFAIDKNSNFILLDSFGSMIKIFTKDGKNIHTIEGCNINSIMPVGVDIDSKSRIVTAWSSGEYLLHIF